MNNNIVYDMRITMVNKKSYTISNMTKEQVDAMKAGLLDERQKVTFTVHPRDKNIGELVIVRDHIVAIGIKSYEGVTK